MRRNNRNHKIKIRVFICPDCNNKMYAPKKSCHMTGMNHIKDMWCPYCKEVKQFEQVGVLS